MSVDPLTLTIVAVVAALLRGDRAAATALLNRMDSIGALSPALEPSMPGEAAAAPVLLWEGRIVDVTPTKLYDPNTSPRRRVVIWNSSAVTIRLAESDAKLRTGAGGPLAPGGIFIDEPPHPHSGEWWAIAPALATIDVAQQT